MVPNPAHGTGAFSPPPNQRLDPTTELVRLRALTGREGKRWQWLPPPSSTDPMQRRWSVLVLAVVALVACQSPSPPEPVPERSTAPRSDVPSSGGPSGGTGRRGVVTRVSDGDTIVVDEDRIRLIGIDAPETNAPGQPVECFGREASARLRGLLPAGTVVRLELDPTNGTRPDQFGRGLAYVHRESDGLFLRIWCWCGRASPWRTRTARRGSTEESWRPRRRRLGRPAADCGGSVGSAVVDAQ
jgi:micrococcal nuclease